MTRGEDSGPGPGARTRGQDLGPGPGARTRGEGPGRGPGTRRTQGEEVTEETTDKIEVAPKQTNPHEKELEKEKEKPENHETEKMMKREQSGEAGGLRTTTSQEVRTVWSTPSEEVPKSTST